MPELNRMLEDKADRQLIQQINGTKASIEEIDSIRKIIDRLALEIDSKTSFKDVDAQIAHSRGCIEDLSKEMMLKASVKDVCQLLD